MRSFTKQSNIKIPFFIPFDKALDPAQRPARFTFPFYYEPHPWCVAAAEQLQTYLRRETDWEYDFGTGETANQDAVGKMFGVLTVESPTGEIGFLAAYSGMLPIQKAASLFVPSVFYARPGGEFYREGERELDKMTAEIKRLTADPQLKTLRRRLTRKQESDAQKIADLRLKVQAAKQARKARRAAAALLPATQRAELEKQLSHESQTWKFRLKDFIRQSKHEVQALETEAASLEKPLQELRRRRKQFSAGLQQKLFRHYRFLNAEGEEKDLLDIFDDLSVPSGAGECAAPKLLQYAFRHKLRPLTMAEFWWGKSPASAVRHHRHFYPACAGKCKPILAHMLDGTPTDPNPLLTNPALGKELPVLYEDAHLVVLNKPAEFLSAPGKLVHDSVQTRMFARYPEATGPMLVHRLDMSTSGILLVAKTKEHYKTLQQQFIKRRVKKRYVAWLEGQVKGNSGRIELPLRVDLDNRPYQIICYKHGRPAVTDWEVVERTRHRTKIYFYPLTGRTHQLRVHAAHPAGLGCPIVGDDLYGTKADRLHLHAEYLEFVHPADGRKVKVTAAVPFD